MKNLQTSGSAPQQPHYDFSALYELLRDDPAGIIQALDNGMFLMTQQAFQSGVAAPSELNKFFSLKQLRDEILKSIHKIDLS